MKPIGIYLHIPFCRSKCAYCDFYSLPGREGEMDAYARELCAHLAQYTPKLADYQADTVYFGGGTPSWFGGARVAAVLEGVRQAVTLSPDCEITMEANPDSVTEEELYLLRAAGVNRLSMGVQSAHETELRTVGRPHTFAQAERAVATARQAGFENISLDLISGLPGQTKALWLESLQAAVALNPEHLSCYGLKLEEGTPLFQNRTRYAFPDEDAQAELYLAGVEYLAAQGYAQYEISNFARPGRQSRHNLKYWTLGAYLGFGPAAHSDFDGVRFGYGRDLNGYLAGVETGRFPVSEGEKISPAERAREYIMLGLRLTRGISGEEYTRIHGDDFKPLEEKLNIFAAHALAERQGGRWRLTPQGMLVSNAILVSLLDTPPSSPLSSPLS